jgi:ATP-binding cassette subfamily C protein CydD
MLAVSTSMNLDRRLLRLISRIPFPLVASIGLGLLAGICLVLQASLLSRIISQVFLEQRSLAEIYPLLVGFLALALLRAALAWGSDATAHNLACQVKGDLRKRLLDHIFTLGPCFTREERSGELVSILFEGVEALEAYFSEYLPKLALAALIPLSFLLFLFPIDLTTSLVLLFTAPLIPFFMILIGSATTNLAQHQWTVLSHLSAKFLDILQGLTTLKIFNRSREQVELIAEMSARFRESTMNILKVAFLSALILEMVATISTAVVAVEIGLRLLYGRLQFNQALFALLLAPEYYLPLRSLGARFHMGATGVTAARRIFKILETKTTTPRGNSQIALCGPPRITFQHIFYQYEGRKTPALKDVSFSLQPGQKLALIGPSGSGKSTMADLLLGFLSPTEGEILVEDRSLQDCDLSSWRSNIAWVPQEPYLFQGTVIENIRLARPQSTLEEVQNAARLAQAESFISQLPHSYETLIGERGQRLSSGQRQRIALARAFLKDAPLLILDEASANLDPENELLVQEAIRELTRDRSTIMIAHRLGTVIDAHQILVMLHGEILETGTHAELMAKGGLYARMVAAYRGATAQTSRDEHPTPEDAG